MRTGIVLALLLMLDPLDADGHGRHPRAYAAFHASLGPHGEWIRFDRDLYVWRPDRVHVGWQPYTVGRWVWTVDGWYWDSDEPWGWATYHYGRWAYDDVYGWVWIPDLEWGPAWVEWRTGPAHLGWAPLGPHSIHHFSSWAWGYHAAPVHHWVFVNYKDVTKRKVYNHFLSLQDCRKHYGQTKDLQSGERRRFGPDRGEIERRGKIRVAQTDIRRETVESKRTIDVRPDPEPGTRREQVPARPRVDDRRESSGTGAGQPRIVDRADRDTREVATSRDNRGQSGRSSSEENRDRSGHRSRTIERDDGPARIEEAGRITPRVPHQD